MEIRTQGREGGVCGFQRSQVDIMGSHMRHQAGTWLLGFWNKKDPKCHLGFLSIPLLKMIIDELNELVL